jgi:hypothetical protein
MTTPIDMAAGWSCTTGASLIAEANSPGTGSLPRLHAVIYVCQAHRADAEARITAAGYTPDVEDAPPSHRWDPWACGHITVYEETAAGRLGNDLDKAARPVVIGAGSPETSALTHCPTCGAPEWLDDGRRGWNPVDVECEVCAGTYTEEADDSQTRDA